MTSRDLPLPISRQRRFREVGRIRFGQKGDRGQPQKLRTFRLTSADRELLTAAAELYGGTVEKWDAGDGVKRYELVTDVDSLPVVVPPVGLVTEALALTQSYELWRAGGCERRCDSVWEKLSDTECPCGGPQVPDHERACSITSRLSVFLPELRGFGVWRMETKSGHAADELGPAIQLLDAAGQSGHFIEARLRLEERSQQIPHPDPEKRAQGKRMRARFMVPCLDVNVSFADLIGGQAPALGRVDHSHAIPEQTSKPVAAIAPTLPEDTKRPRSPKIGRPELEPAPGRGPVQSPKVDLSDMSVSSPQEPTRAAEPPAPSDPAPEPETPQEEPSRPAEDDSEPADEERRKRQLLARLSELQKTIPDLAGDDARHALVSFVTGGRTQSSKDLTGTDSRLANDVLDLIAEGTAQLIRADDGIFLVDPTGGWYVVADGRLTFAIEPEDDTDIEDAVIVPESDAPAPPAEVEAPRTQKELKERLRAAGTTVTKAIRAAQELTGEDTPSTIGELLDRPDLLAQILGGSQ